MSRAVTSCITQLATHSITIETFYIHASEILRVTDVVNGKINFRIPKRSYDLTLRCYQFSEANEKGITLNNIIKTVPERCGYENEFRLDIYIEHVNI